MEDEFVVYQSKVGELKDELQRVHRQHQEAKKRFYEQQRHDRQERGATNNYPVQILPPQLPRFTGGGFNLSL